MKVSFYFVLAFAVMLLAVSAKSKDKPLAEPKLDVSTEKTEETRTSTENGNKETSTSSPEEGVSSTSSGEVTTERPLSEEQRCSEMIGKFINGVFKGLEVQYDVEKLLEKYGGAPGKVNATWTEKEDAPVAKEDLETRPLPDADEKYWLYKYGDTDFDSYIRIEHAVRRFSGTPKAFLEVRGELYFKPDDFCGNARHAIYTMDDQGFTSKVGRSYCSISKTTVSCASPASCKVNKEGSIMTCIAAPSSALLATLVGGGK